MAAQVGGAGSLDQSRNSGGGDLEHALKVNL